MKRAVELGWSEDMLAVMRGEDPPTPLPLEKPFILRERLTVLQRNRKFSEAQYLAKYFTERAVQVGTPSMTELSQSSSALNLGSASKLPRDSSKFFFGTAKAISGHSGYGDVFWLLRKAFPLRGSQMQRAKLMKAIPQYIIKQFVPAAASFEKQNLSTAEDDDEMKDEGREKVKGCYPVIKLSVQVSRMVAPVLLEAGDDARDMINSLPDSLQATVVADMALRAFQSELHSETPDQVFPSFLFVSFLFFSFLFFSFLFFSFLFFSFLFFSLPL